MTESLNDLRSLVIQTVVIDWSLGFGHWGIAGVTQKRTRSVRSGPLGWMVMTENMKVTVERKDGIAVICTDGYINNQGGEEIARVAYQLIDEGYRNLLLNLEKTKIVNSIGISILIEIIEKMLAIQGRLGFCHLTPTINKTFHIMGLAQYTTIYPDQTSALAQEHAAS